MIFTEDESHNQHHKRMSAITPRQHGTEDTVDDIHRTDESHHHHHKRMSATRKNTLWSKSSFLTAHQHILGHSVPYNGVEDGRKQ